MNNKTTVADLIELLKDMPQDMAVLYEAAQPAWLREDAWNCYNEQTAPMEERLREAERLLRSALTEIVVTDPTATVYGEIVTWLENDLKG
jgi:hypothetical protein